MSLPHRASSTTTKMKQSQELEDGGRATHSKVADEGRHVRLVDAAHACQRASHVGHVRVVDAFADQVGRFALVELVRFEVAAGFLGAARASFMRKKRVSARYS